MNINELFPPEKWFPSRQLHCTRNNYNVIPAGTLTAQTPYHSFVDESGNIWSVDPWYYTLFHNPIKNVKFINYASNVDTLGSSEIIVRKKNIDKGDKVWRIAQKDIEIGSFNYRDLKKTSQIKHLIADALPVLVYCTCVGH